MIRGETPHFDYICEGVTYGIARLNATQEIPVIYGLLTTNDLQQAKDRSGGLQLLRQVMKLVMPEVLSVMEQVEK